MKMNRLFEITTILLNKGNITANELAERFGVSTRTIYRDIDVLSGAGVPVYMNKGKGGGIYLLEEFALDRTLISSEEGESLLLAIKTLQATQYPEVDTVLEKMAALFKNASEQDWVEVDFSPWGSNPNEKNKFNDIKRALLRRNVIRFQYVNAEGQKSVRLTEPGKLVFKNNAWYLAAFCRQRQERRTFRISRIKKLEVLTEAFEPRIPGPENESVESSQSYVRLVLHFQAKALNRLYDYFDDSVISQHEDGSFSLTVSLLEGEWIYGYILSFGNLVEVMEPAAVRKNIAERLRQTIKIYET